MTYPATLLTFGLFAVIACVGCDSSRGRPGPDSEVIPPDQIMEFNVLYASNCAGCHGSEGKGGAAIPLGDPVFLAIADDAAIRQTAANGVPGTPMPAFAKSAGGMLTDKQIDAIVSGIRSWTKPDSMRGACEALLARAAHDVDAATRARLRVQLYSDPDLADRVLPRESATHGLIETARQGGDLAPVLAACLGVTRSIAT